MGAPVVRWQIISSQPEAVSTFYSRLFGWTIKSDNALGYRELLTGAAKGIDGGVWPAPPGQPGMLQLFIEVPDIDACLTEAVRLGAKVIVPRSDLPDGDSMAILLDPTGMSVGVCRLAPKA